jgi:hypothetical protein
MLSSENLFLIDGSRIQRAHDDGVGPANIA